MFSIVLQLEFLFQLSLSVFRYFVHPKRASIRDDYYSAAVDNGEELFTFTVAGIVARY